MRIVPRTSVTCATLAACLCISPLFAGALMLEVENPATSPEAVSKNAMVVARVTECQSPEKTVVTATAEGLVSGKRQSVPLKLIRLSAPGFYAVSREWPAEGNWAVKLVVTNPDYGKYVTAAVVSAGKQPFTKESVRRFYRIPTEQDIDSVLAQDNH